MHVYYVCVHECGVCVYACIDTNVNVQCVVLKEPLLYRVGCLSPFVEAVCLVLGGVALLKEVWHWECGFKSIPFSSSLDDLV